MSPTQAHLPLQVTQVKLVSISEVATELLPSVGTAFSRHRRGDSQGSLCMSGLGELVAFSLLGQVTNDLNMRAVFDNVDRWLFLLRQGANVLKNIRDAQCFTGNCGLFLGDMTQNGGMCECVLSI